MPKWKGRNVTPEFLALARDERHGAAARASFQRKVDRLKSLDVAAAFGADVAHDRIGITDWRPDTCGCVLRYAFHIDAQEDERVHHALEPVEVCAVHRDHDDQHRHHADVVAENRHKNRSRAALAAELGVDEGEITHSFDADRALHLHHAKLKKPRVFHREG